MNARYLVLLSALALAMPTVAGAQARSTGGYAVPRRDATAPRAPAQQSPAYRAGYERGVRGGEDDGRRNQTYDYRNKGDYRSGDAGYRREYGDRDRYRIDFRLGFEIGYRDGYDRYRGGYGRNDGWRPGDGQPPWANGRARGQGGGPWAYGNQAHVTGYNDGYEAGLRDGRDRRRFNPTDEGRYRSADRGYNRAYGSREEYRFRYREGFRQGYERGYEDTRRYGNRYDSRPWWWPF